MSSQKTLPPSFIAVAKDAGDASLLTDPSARLMNARSMTADLNAALVRSATFDI
jgi:hypothetical protein